MIYTFKKKVCLINRSNRLLLLPSNLYHRVFFVLSRRVSSIDKSIMFIWFFEPFSTPFGNCTLERSSSVLCLFSTFPHKQTSLWLAIDVETMVKIQTTNNPVKWLRWTNRQNKALINCHYISCTLSMCVCELRSRW